MPNNRKRMIGRVVSDKMEKTIVVAIERRKMHRVYKKVVTSTKKVMAHDETNEIQIGSVVQLVESKPLSKNKRWLVEKVLEGPGGRVLNPVLGDVRVAVIPERPDNTPAVAEVPVEAEAEVEAPAVVDEAPVEAEAEVEAPVVAEVPVEAEAEVEAPVVAEVPVETEAEEPAAPEASAEDDEEATS